MKTDKEWQKIGLSRMVLTAEIQRDALLHAARLIHNMSRGTKSEDRAIALDEAEVTIADEANSLLSVFDSNKYDIDNMPD